MISEVIISRLDELIGNFDTPFISYLIYSYDLTLEDCELIVSKIRNDINDGAISADENLVEIIERRFEDMRIESEKRVKLEYLASLMDRDSQFYAKFLKGYDVTSKDEDIIYERIERKINEDNIGDFEIKRDLVYYFSNAIKRESYIKKLNAVVGRNYDTLIIASAKRSYPNVHDRDIVRIANELHAEIMDGISFPSVKKAFLDKVMRTSEAKKAEAIRKWDDLVLGNGDSFNILLETRNLSIEDGEKIKEMVRSRILDGLVCADKIDGTFLTRICEDYALG